MKHLALVLLVACGGAKAPPPVSNTADTASDVPATSPTGAGTSREVQRTAAGGVIELSGDRTAAMNHAAARMGTHCEPAGYVIVQEGEEVVTSSPVTTAWRVHYQCDH